MLDGKKVIESIFASVVGTMIIKLVSKENEMTIMGIVFFILAFVVYFSFDYLVDIFLYINRRFFLNFMIKKSKGFFGRKNAILAIIEEHKNSKGNLVVGLICGLGGSGKSALADNFGKMTALVVRSVRINNANDLHSVKKFRNNTIILIDDAYNYTRNRDDCKSIINFLEECRASNKHLSIWFLDRTSLKEFILSNFEIKTVAKEINLNEYIADNEVVLFDIFKNKLKQSTDKKLNEYVSLIKERFDPDYCRPIWAVMMSEVLLKNPLTDFNNFASKEVIVEQYWENMINRRKFASFIEELCKADRQEDVELVKNELIKRTESLMLFCAITSISIRIEDSVDNRIISFERDGEKYENATLAKLIRGCLTLGEYPLRRYLLMRLFPVEENIYSNNSMVITLKTYDLVTSCLLGVLIRKGNNNDSIILNLLKSVSKELSQPIVTFATRASDDDRGVALHWWAKKIYAEDSFLSYDNYEEWIIQWCKLYSNSEKSDLHESMVNAINRYVSNMKRNAEVYEKFKNFINQLRTIFLVNGEREYIAFIDQINFLDNAEEMKVKRRGEN